jgi:hypothetical protein
MIPIDKIIILLLLVWRIYRFAGASSGDMTESLFMIELPMVKYRLDCIIYFLSWTNLTYLGPTRRMIGGFVWVAVIRWMPPGERILSLLVFVISTLVSDWSPFLGPKRRISLFVS